MSKACPRRAAEANAHPEVLAGRDRSLLRRLLTQEQQRDPGITEVTEMPNRPHSLTIDKGPPAEIQNV